MNINFPKPDKNPNEKDMNPLNELESFCQRFNSMYEGHFLGVITTNSTLMDNSKTLVVGYAFWIDFLRMKNYSYRFFEVKPTSMDGGYPVSVTAFQAPSVEFEKANNPKELEDIIDGILNSERGRFIILSNY